jgi:hypothetical protein
VRQCGRACLGGRVRWWCQGRVAKQHNDTNDDCDHKEPFLQPDAGARTSSDFRRPNRRRCPRASHRRNRRLYYSASTAGVLPTAPVIHRIRTRPRGQILTSVNNPLATTRRPLAGAEPRRPRSRRLRRALAARLRQRSSATRLSTRLSRCPQGGPSGES